MNNAPLVLGNWQLNTPTATPQPYIPWWSFTKTLIATSTLLLCEQNALTLDTPLKTKSFTLRQLLQHTAGLPDYGGLTTYAAAVKNQQTPWSITKLLTNSNANTLLFKPGTNWRYSNIGYLLVRQQLEYVTGLSLADIIQTLILKPLGIHDAYLATTPEELAVTQLESLRSYHPAWVYHGLMVGTPGAAVMILDALSSGRLLSDASFRAMTDAYVLGGKIPGRPWRTPAYGLGLMIDASTPRVWGHTGQGPGSTVAVYHVNAPHPRTVLAFAQTPDQGAVETSALELVQPAAS